MSMYRFFSCVVGRGCLLWPVHSLGKTLLACALLHSVLQGQICLLLQVSLDFLLLQDGQVMVKSSDKTWCTGEGNGKPLQHSCLEYCMSRMKRQKDRTLKDELPRFIGTQYATGNQWRTNSRKNEEMEPKQKQCPVVDVTGDGNKVWCCQEQYCIGTWNVRSMLLLLLLSRFSCVRLCATP